MEDEEESHARSWRRGRSRVRMNTEAEGQKEREEKRGTKKADRRARIVATKRDVHRSEEGGVEVA